ncbi:hypothetical protein ABIB62_003848 [Mucilaginibacter sp. UYP25]
MVVYFKGHHPLNTFGPLAQQVNFLKQNSFHLLQMCLAPRITSELYFSQFCNFYVFKQSFTIISFYPIRSLCIFDT